MNKKMQWIIQGAVMGAAFGLSASAYAYDEHSGCRIVLCLANPKGPMAESECRPDIKQMLSDLKNGHKPPKCDEAEKSGTYYTMRNDHYGLCPDGHSDSRKLAGISGKYVFTLDNTVSMPSKPSQAAQQPSSNYVKALAPYHNNPAVGMTLNGGTALACVPGGASYTTSKVCLQWQCSSGNYDCSCTTEGTVRTFNSKITWNVFKPSPFVADVFISNKIWHRARLNGDASGDVRADIEQKYY